MKNVQNPKLLKIKDKLKKFFKKVSNDKDNLNLNRQVDDTKAYPRDDLKMY